MPYRPERPVSTAAIWARKLGIFALALTVAAFLFQRFDIITMANAVAVILLAGGLAVFVVGLSIIGFVMLWLIGARGGRASFVGLLMAAMVLGPVGYGVSRYLLLPPINDISTDVISPPEWLKAPQISSNWLPRSQLTAADARTLQVQAYPKLTGRRYEGAIDRVLETVTNMATERKWSLVLASGTDYLSPGQAPPDATDTGNTVAEPGPIPIPQPRPEVTEGMASATEPVVLLQYSWRSPILGVPHDILLRLVEEEETTFVDLRAAERVGQHDLGTNASLVQDFLRDLDVALLGIAGN